MTTVIMCDDRSEEEPLPDTATKRSAWVGLAQDLIPASPGPHVQVTVLRLLGSRHW